MESTHSDEPYIGWDSKAAFEISSPDADWSMVIPTRSSEPLLNNNQNDIDGALRPDPGPALHELNHIDHPYPTDEEKAELGGHSGLSKTQVGNWFVNARRRQRMNEKALSQNNIFTRGSPMPESFLSSIPLQRWQNSPPEEEPASLSQINNALKSSHHPASSCEPLAANTIDPRCLSVSESSTELFMHLPSYASSDSRYSSYSHNQSDSNPSRPASACNSEDSDQSWGRGLLKARRIKKTNFQCTFCSHVFEKRFDWLRHERSVHLPGLDKWICGKPLAASQSASIWRIDQDSPECVFCGQVCPDDTHFVSHEFEACEERSLQDRTFTRKDHLWQHLYKFHGCRKWCGWSPDLAILKETREDLKSRCGFCQAALSSWDERGNHLTKHFRAGHTMADWVGDVGIEDVEMFQT
ncbi:hypothetical protein TruAng_005199 [Truncatella angustata]|nr:hypothetical protein TruAng_005199 [Truncatella angustata]